jgi:hypothetical protein
MVVFFVFVAACFGAGALCMLAQAVNYRGWRTEKLRHGMRKAPFTLIFPRRWADSPAAIRAYDTYAQVVCWIVLALATFGFVYTTVSIARGI